MAVAVTLISLRTVYILSHLSDKHKYFGAILESEVVLLLDASSSMTTHWSEVKGGVTKLLRNFPPHIKRYSITLSVNSNTK